MTVWLWRRKLHAFLAFGSLGWGQLPEAVAQGSLTSLREKLIKIAATVVRHARYAVFQMAEVAVPRELFERTLRLIDGLGRRTPPAKDRTNASSPREECVRMMRQRAKSMDQ